MKIQTTTLLAILAINTATITACSNEEVDPGPSDQSRSTSEVFDHHVKALNEGNLDEVASDYAADAVFITKDDGTVRGIDAIQKWFGGTLSGPLVGAQFKPTTLISEGETLYLEWEAEGTTNQATGVDTFVIRGGEIHAQTAKLISISPK